MNETTQPRATRTLVMIQALLGVGVYTTFGLPYLRRLHGLERLQPRQNYLFTANHVSLLDTILLGGLFWRHGYYPILTLGDKRVWHASWLKRLLSNRTGFLMERGKINPRRIAELQTFGRAGREFNLVVYPEGTRGDGTSVGSCQAGLYYVAQEARLPIVPVFIENMQLVSTKTGGVHPITGLRKVEVHFGAPVAPEKYLSLSREEFTEFVRQGIAALKPKPATAHWSPVPSRA
jgi:1-acyl-sn-glycerol-3-phosphate acyltransferase